MGPEGWLVLALGLAVVSQQTLDPIYGGTHCKFILQQTHVQARRPRAISVVACPHGSEPCIRRACSIARGEDRAPSLTTSKLLRSTLSPVGRWPTKIDL